MHKRELQQLVKLGEDSGRQFKADVTESGFNRGRTRPARRMFR
jgi:hypothetical protein